LVFMGEKAIIDVNDQTWEALIERRQTPILVMFHSPTCPHCQAMMPHFLQYAEEFKDKIPFARLNVLENPYTVNRYAVVSTPTFKFFCGGRPIQELVGAVYPTILKGLVEDVLQYGSSCVEKSTMINYDVAYV